MAPKTAQMAVSSDKYSFCQRSFATAFCIKTNLRENRFFAARWVIVGKKGTHNVKFLAEKLTGCGKLTS